MDRARFYQAEAQRLLSEVPDWGEEKLRVAVDTVKSLGFSDDEVVAIADSRLIKGSLELANLRSENAALRARVEKGVKPATTVKKNVPKVITPGKKVQTSKAKVKRDTLSQAKNRLQKTGSVRDAANVLMALDAV